MSLTNPTPPPGNPPSATERTAEPGDADMRELPPGFVAVICPQGFTASSMKEHNRARPLYARLVYRPL